MEGWPVICCAARFSCTSPATPLRSIAPQPYVPSFARDPEARAQLSHRLFIPLILKTKPQLLLYHTARFPGHAVLLHAIALLRELSGMLPVCSVRDAPGLYP